MRCHVTHLYGQVVDAHVFLPESSRSIMVLRAKRYIDIEKSSEGLQHYTWSTVDYASVTRSVTSIIGLQLFCTLECCAGQVMQSRARVPLPYICVPVPQTELSPSRHDWLNFSTPTAERCPRSRQGRSQKFVWGGV